MNTGGADTATTVFMDGGQRPQDDQASWWLRATGMVIVA